MQRGKKLADVIRYTVLWQDFMFAVLEPWLIYDCETDSEYSYVHVIFALLLHKFYQWVQLDLYAFLNTFEVSIFNRSGDMEGVPKF